MSNILKIIYTNHYWCYFKLKKGLNNQPLNYGNFEF